MSTTATTDHDTRHTRLLQAYIADHGGTEAVRMAQLHANGKTYADVGKQYNCSASTAHARIHKITAALDRVGYCPPSWKLRDRVHRRSDKAE